MDEDNPLRQVIINTHSPLVVAQVKDDELLLAEPWGSVQNNRVVFCGLQDTWHTKGEDRAAAVSRGQLLG